MISGQGYQQPLVVGVFAPVLLMGWSPQLFDAFLATTELVAVYYRWRPNLRDEGDNHVVELAVAASDAPIVTYNRRDFRGGELSFPQVRVYTPTQWLKEIED